ncbi:MAG: hypothetical protein KKD39_05075 [Candidatus Altiarchaeota archaeon]|nr:hypothetical protein [Candidatus Altiarchaeota archaeon]
MDRVLELHEATRKLDDMSQKITKPTAVELKVLSQILSELEQSKKIKAIFGQDPLTNLGIVAVSNDLRIIDIDKIKLSEEQKKAFLDELNQIISSHMARV